MTNYRRGPNYAGLMLACLACLPFTVIKGLAQNMESQPNSNRLTLSEVIDKLTEKNAERAAALQEYRSRRTYQLDYAGFPSHMHAEMVVDMIYNAPDTEVFKVVSQTGPKWMVNMVLKRLMETEQESISPKYHASVEITSENYNFTMLDPQDATDGCSYVLGVEPKNPNKFLFRGKIWVDDKDFAVCRIEAEPAKNPSFWIKSTVIHHSFEKVGDFWFPAENQSVSRVRMDGRATLTIEYGDYQIQEARSLAMVTPKPSAN